jgi:hypothetical protein
MNLVSISLYGTNPKYLFGAIENARRIAESLPGWTLRVYCGNDVPAVVISNLRSNGCQIEMQNDFWHPNGMFWRYLPLGEPGIDRVIFRDADSRIDKRERDCIEQWTLSDYAAHIIRDHPFHQTPILGGLWGISNKNLNLLEFWRLAAKYNSNFSEDQRFLANHVYPSIRNDCLVHDQFFAFEPRRVRIFPAVSSESYMGESYSETNGIEQEMRTIRNSFQTSLTLQLKLKFMSSLQSKFFLGKSYFVSERALSIPKG